MENIIKAFDTIGANIKMRPSVDLLRKQLKEHADNEIDFSSVTFISRSVADELCNLENESSVTFINMSEAVSNMMNVVRVGRKSKRVYDTNMSDIVKVSDMNELTALLSE